MMKNGGALMSEFLGAEFLTAAFNIVAKEFVLVKWKEGRKEGSGD